MVPYSLPFVRHCHRCLSISDSCGVQSEGSDLEVWKILSVEKFRIDLEEFRFVSFKVC